MTTKKFIVLIACFLSAAACAISAKPVGKQASIQHPADSIGFSARGGLPNFYSKISRGNSIKIAYLGGSITSFDGGWRDQTFNYFKSTFPNVKFSQVIAAVSGTGSDLGVFRVDHDVLQYHPDLVFVEFAVNDQGYPDQVVTRSMEGIVRKIWKNDPHTDICFVYTVNAASVSFLQKGQYQPSAACMEKVAAHYGIPSIHVGVDVAKLVTDNRLVMTGEPEKFPGKMVFTKDGTHPDVEGHRIYTAQMVKRLNVLKSNNSMAVSHNLPEPIDPKNWENVLLKPLSDLANISNWQQQSTTTMLSKRYAADIPYVYKAITPNAEFKVNFTGDVIGFYDLIGPGSGIISIDIDGKQYDLQRFDKSCTYYRPASFFIDSLNNSTYHNLTIKVTGKQFDKTAIIKNAAGPNYSDNSWFPGFILVNGRSKISE